MRWIEIKGMHSVNGTIDVPGSKNSSLALLAACCLTEEQVILENVPDISDIEVIQSIGKDIGLEIIRRNENVIIDPSNIMCAVIDPEKSSLYRASYYFIGALLAKFKKVTIGYPGGDNFGRRPIDQHIKAFEALGAKVTFYNDYYEVAAEKLIGKNIYFDVITSGATINAILAAVLAEGRTTILNAARDPEIVDLAIMLSEMGAKIKGAGTETITIDGVDKLEGCTHKVIPDRLIAGSFIIAAGATRGNITVNNVTPEHLVSCTEKLKEAGVTIEAGDSYINAYAAGDIHGVNVKATMYPGFATDLQQPLTSMLLTADSHSTLIDKVYPNRFGHCLQLNRMGANIILKDGSATIPARRKIVGNWVHATDIRAGMSLIIAGLIAEGVTRITGVEHIKRGYSDAIECFKSLGADIKLCEDAEKQDTFENFINS
ncbi:UDP-N-acetylglucosamine 1-carboxyvinyltransferase [Clostridium oryzae]|uniref:UDP-N-acetylglucosamine 1-carboxyvinyltransferase n=1 Tax=Clostridium oryzae TaxID=1450648 RepID=A0A1V4ICE1_9CLOT|nr:UDP-N-acetylglucosamine 1-carboxyvinyltransferase [Clostridium oryzae]OPJ57603.1 UDP-N-acetylglucosamine 1-carboxyvinyltransferase 2 [Clostridium oryzae]